MGTIVFVLGAPDPEMEQIEELVRDTYSARVMYALVRRERVRSEAAYSFDAAVSPYGVSAANMLAADDRVILVECQPASAAVLDDAFVVERIDHHRPGDPGFGRPPSDYLAASSLGQVLAALARYREITEKWALDYDWTRIRRDRAPELSAGWSDGALAIGDGYRGDVSCGWFSPPDYIRFVAAADHCLAHAYRGMCPGVDPDALMFWRLESRAKFQGRSVKAIIADVERARQALREADDIELDADTGVRARDMRRRHVPELPEASAREGICFVADGLPLADGRMKIVCQSGTPEQIRAFVERWAPAHGLRDIYGDPARGFAGGYK